MKTYNNLYEPMLSKEEIKDCFRTAAKKKTTRRDVKQILDNLDEHVEILYETLLNEDFIPAFHVPKVIRENSCKKERRIVKPNYKYEQVVHHCVIRQFQPIVLDGLYEHSNGSIPGRGCHSGSKTMKKWIRGYHGKKFYVLKMDIRHFFDSIDRRILKRKLALKIKDKRYLRLLYILIEYDKTAELVKLLRDNKALPKADDEESLKETKAILRKLVTMVAYDETEEAVKYLSTFNLTAKAKAKAEGIIRDMRKGVPLGYYTSQWFGNFYLKELDHYIVQDLGADHFMRYMDDMVITGRNKKKLHRIREAIGDYLHDELNLELKADWQVFRFEYDTGEVDENGEPIIRGRMLDFMGFQFHYNRKTLRKSTLHKARRKALNIGRKKAAGGKTSWYDSTQMLSYMGSISHSDTYGYYLEYIKPTVNVKKLKKIISNHARKEHRKNVKLNNHMENRSGIAA